MPLKSQLKLIISSLIILLLVPIGLYFFAESEFVQFLINFSGYYGAIISILGIYLVMIYYVKHKEELAKAEKKRLKRGYFQIEKIKTSPKFTNLALEKTSKLLITDNFKHYETDKEMNFYRFNLITEAKMLLNLEINLEYKDLKFIDKLYVARVEAESELFIPQRLSQTVENTFELVELKSIKLTYETLAGEKMNLTYDNDYQKLSCFGEDSSGAKVKLYTEYFNELELRSLR